MKKLIVLFLVLSLVFTGFLRRQQPLNPKKVTEAIGIPYERESIPISSKRLGKKRHIKYIVVHNTDNPTSQARQERDYLTCLENDTSTSWHLVVDDHEIIEAIPLTEIAHHAGNRKGNQKGIGIEICEAGDYKKTEENAIELIVYLMKTYHIPLENVKTHKDFSGKECPHIILNYWDEFKERIQTTLELKN